MTFYRSAHMRRVVNARWARFYANPTLTEIDTLLIEEVRKGPATSFDVSYEVGADFHAVSARLGKLHRWGLLRRSEIPGAHKQFLYELA